MACQAAGRLIQVAIERLSIAPTNNLQGRQMKLEKLSLSRGYSGDQPLTGEVQFSTPDEHRLTLKLNEDDAIAIVELCAEAIARTGREAAKALTADALKFTAIEHEADK